MPTGKVKFFNSEKGYGFIEPEGGGRDVFLHSKEIAAGHIMAQGKRVTFDVKDDPRGPKATNVKLAKVQPTGAA